MKENLSAALLLAQDNCIGLFRPPGGVVELVTEHTESGFTTITIGNLFGLSTSYYGSPYLKDVVMFPENNTLTSMMKESVRFSNWYNRYF